VKSNSRIRALVRIVLSVAAGLVFLVCLVVVIAWMSGFFGKKIEPGYSSVGGVAATAEERKNAYRVNERVKKYIEEAVGTLKAADRTEISARVLATIEAVKVRAGSMVKEGDTLVVLDRRALETQLSQARAALAAASAAVDAAENDYRRTDQLYRRQVASRAEFDQATEKVKVTRAQLKSAQDALTEAEVLLSYTTITAPKPGMIVDRLAEPGDMARPGEPLLVLYDPKSLRLEVPVVEKLAVNLKVGDKLQVHIDARNRDVQAVVDEIVPQAEAASRSFLVKLRLPRSDDLFEGMFGRLLIPVGERRHLCLLTAAIQTIGQLQFVEVIGPDGLKHRRLIKTGRLGDPGHVEVLSGLEKGELVVVPQRKDTGNHPPPDQQTQPTSDE
jgi:membrane fusion protein (multidrug efflux system)